MSTAKPAAAAKTDAPPAQKSKKMLFIIIAAVVLIGGGAAAYFLMKPAHAPNKDEVAVEEAHSAKAPTYVTLGTFTANLIHEEGDRYLQVAISVKITNPELEEKIKVSNPEILHHVNMLLQSKAPSELATLAGKDKLASEIKSRIEQILGLSKHAAAATETQAESAPTPTETIHSKTGIDEVLFTSFIIQ